MNLKNKNILRQTRIREKIKKSANGRYRLSIFRSSKNIYAQIIDDDKGKTLLSSSTLDKKIKSKFKNTGNKEAASEIGKILKISAGYSHDIDYQLPEGINIKCQDPNTVEISGANKTQVGQVAADIRSFRKPEPYKGKGIKYENEYIFRKEGKKK